MSLPIVIHEGCAYTLHPESGVLLILDVGSAVGTLPDVLNDPADSAWCEVELFEATHASGVLNRRVLDALNTIVGRTRL